MELANYSKNMEHISWVYVLVPTPSCHLPHGFNTWLCVALIVAKTSDRCLQKPRARRTTAGLRAVKPDRHRSSTEAGEDCQEGRNGNNYRTRPSCRAILITGHYFLGEATKTIDTFFSPRHTESRNSDSNTKELAAPARRLC